jgi:serine protease Do
VVENAEEILVTLADGREFDAAIVGTDPQSDVAVIQVEGKPENLELLPFGDSSRLRLGEVVLAIGNPFGLSHTVTMGIVSATGRANVGIADYEDFIQTDAAINPGNSGGGPG